MPIANSPRIAHSLRIATWNINSVRLRIDQVARFVALAGPNILCLQEIKCRNEEFPSAAFKDMGLPHLEIVGQKGWHGVAIAADRPLSPAEVPDLCRQGEARAAAVVCEGLEIHNLYVPAGGDEPDPEANPKFAHKLDFLARMREIYAAGQADRRLVLLGDLNVAPGEHDVWSHKQLLNVVSHTPVETDAMTAILSEARFIDVARALRPEPEKIFTWWSYRSPDWTRNNRGRRLDHIWVTKALEGAAGAYEAHVACRAWDQPSDHVPVTIDLAL